MIEVPLSSDPEQKFTIALNSVLYTFRVYYNSRANLWALDISLGTVALINGIALTIGDDIMSPYVSGPERLYMINITDSSLDADATNLGTDVKLFQLTAGEVASVTSV